MATTASNVTAAKPAVAGAIWVGPANDSNIPTTVTDIKFRTATGWSCLGYISEDGLSNDNSPESESVKAWGGDIVYIAHTSKEDTFGFTLIESRNQAVLETIYGADNVTVDTDGTITVKANNNANDSFAMVVDMITADNFVKRICVPNGMVSEVGSITYADGEVTGYETTVTAIPDASGNTHYEYIQTKSAS